MPDPHGPARLALRLLAAAATLSTAAGAVIALGILFLGLGSGGFLWGAIGLVALALPASLLALAFAALHLRHRVPREEA